jgi:hypothetical protein
MAKHTDKVLRILNSQDVAVRSQVKTILLMLFEHYGNVVGVNDDDLITNLSTIIERLNESLSLLK